LSGFLGVPYGKKGIGVSVNSCQVSDQGEHQEQKRDGAAARGGKTAVGGER